MSRASSSRGRPLFVTLAVVPGAGAQQPFFTDDADVAEGHHFHFETNAEYDVLPSQSFPNLRQLTQTVKFS
jgi:hypothetical protein